MLTWITVSTFPPYARCGSCSAENSTENTTTGNPRVIAHRAASTGATAEAAPAPPGAHALYHTEHWPIGTIAEPTRAAVSLIVVSIRSRRRRMRRIRCA
ncbi:MAG: hypothetical protein ACHBNF_21750 [Chromatiales bacterium]